MLLPAAFPKAAGSFTGETALVRKISSVRSHAVGKPNFNFQKRQKEIAKKKKSEEKRQRKLDKKATQPSEDQGKPAEGEEAAGTEHAETNTERG